MNTDYNIIILGGGLAGLTCALHLSRNNLSVLLVEKSKYPHHKVCGEYISNEVLPYLESLDIYPLENNAKQISKLVLSVNSGKSLEQQLPLGGFGMSRYFLDDLMAKKARETATLLKGSVKNIEFHKTHFSVNTAKGESFTSSFVIGAYGKRSNLDKVLDRGFALKKSPWLAVKAHYKAEFRDDVVALHHFDGGYCGLSKVENGHVNMCYLANYNSFKNHKNIADFEQNVVKQNPYLKEFLKYATPLFEEPLAISQISFESKKPVENHILMVGDSAGLIHPLCGNGMAMAIHSAKILSELLVEHYKGASENREILEDRYRKRWNATFKSRLRTASVLQKILMRPKLLQFGVEMATRFPTIVPRIIKKTHGKPLTIK
ncbi:MAG: NAD(P)/FAD-dependent oxidoreductase [Flavobacteriales bacterium]|nr:NAD(P)/FAD-dependent oxidoreductase [Flavobacteriales bacterium]